jgi:hypothetical protein
MSLHNNGGEMTPTREPSKIKSDIERTLKQKATLTSSDIAEIKESIGDLADWIEAILSSHPIPKG